jgi:hypothetical protein
VVRTYAFPIGFLFFMVPFGEFLFPTMMQWTADFIIWAVRASGVPVYAEGFLLVIPSGRWQVVEGCSGVRYLMASIVVGSLYAYLNYRSTQKRLLFVAASIVMPVLRQLAARLRHRDARPPHRQPPRGRGRPPDLRLGLLRHHHHGAVLDRFALAGGRGAGAGRHPVRLRGIVLGGTCTRFAWAGWPRRWSRWACGCRSSAYLDRQGEQGPVRFAALDGQGAWQRRRCRANCRRGRRAIRACATPTDRPGARGAFRSGCTCGYYRDQGPGRELINSENRVLISKDPVWRMTAAGPVRKCKLGDQAQAWRTLEMASAACTHGRLVRVLDRRPVDHQRSSCQGLSGAEPPARRRGRFGGGHAACAHGQGGHAGTIARA